MTGKTDMVPVLNLPSHLSQPSQSENVPIFGRGTRCYFAPEKSRFWSKPREGKGKFTATPRLAPVARGVAACGPMCGLAGRRWGTDTTQPIWARVGELFGAPKAKQEKGAASWTPPSRSLLPTVRAVGDAGNRSASCPHKAGIALPAVQIEPRIAGCFQAYLRERGISAHSLLTTEPDS